MKYSERRTNNMPDIKTYSVSELENILKVGKRTIRAYISSGKLKAAKVGKSYVVKHEDLEKFIAENS